MKLNRLLKMLLAISLLSAVVTVSSYADRGDLKRDHARDFKNQPDKYRQDKRHRHDQYYPRHGRHIDRLPHRHQRIHHHNSDYYFYGGIWYRPSGTRYIVVNPPLGIVVTTLPSVYSTLWYSGTPYYYANDTYYVWKPERDGYVVTDPPPEIEKETPIVMENEQFIYPKQGQSEKQQADDRFACHSWGVSQTDYDPSKLPKGLTASQLSNRREAYQRALRACLEGKGYSVR